jgi:5-hydroxyisourate hydrolase-like protein (transthyretin family)
MKHRQTKWFSNAFSTFLCGCKGIAVVGIAVTTGSGIAVAGDLTGAVTDKATGRPVFGAQVTVIEPHGKNPEVHAAIDTALDGTYALQGIQTGTYAVTVTAKGYIPTANKAVAIPASGQTPLNFQLDAMP